MFEIKGEIAQHNPYDAVAVIAAKIYCAVELNVKQFSLLSKLRNYSRAFPAASAPKQETGTGNCAENAKMVQVPLLSSIPHNRLRHCAGCA